MLCKEGEYCPAIIHSIEVIPCLLFFERGLSRVYLYFHRWAFLSTSSGAWRCYRSMLAGCGTNPSLY